MLNEVRTPVSSEDESVFLPFSLMEEILDRLKMLNYDEEFIKTLKMRPLNRHYFAIPSNPGEQFFMFISLSAWLIRKIGMPFDQPQEYDDPNSVIATILEAMRKLEIRIDFSPSKLKKGSGIHTLHVLSSLVDKALEEVRFVYKKPSPPVEAEDTSEIVDDDIELVLDRVEEEMAAEDSDNDEDNVLNIDDLYAASAFVEPPKHEDVLESKMKLEDWNLELERVLPMLKVSVKSNSGDWRSHFDTMKTHQSSLEEIFSPVTNQLQKLKNEIDGTLQKISKREKLINSQFETLLDQYRTFQEELSVLNEQYKEVNGGVLERQRLLSQLSDSLESVKQEMEERGVVMSDGTPLVHIKKAIKEIKKEICEMDINIAVAENVIIEARMREKSFESHLIRSSGAI